MWSAPASSRSTSRARKCAPKNLKAAEGDWLSIDGTAGEVILGQLPTQPSEVLQVVLEGKMPLEKSAVSRAFTRILTWADERRRLRIRANADTPHDARVARLFGAEGIGLCRTEHMFFDEKRIGAVREMILAETIEQRRAALAKILPMQREDFCGIFREMGERPVTIRLLDPPLHEFLPHDEETMARTAADLKVPVEKVRERTHALKEANPMLGHRGCRLGITNPEIYEMQVRAIFEAAQVVIKEGISPNPEIMIPLVGARGEFERLRVLVEAAAKGIAAETGQAVPYLIGTMIEIPRAALRANRIALNCDFFSFGTNDLTQMTYGYSRDDMGTFLPVYIAEGILPEDPFASLDQYGVGELDFDRGPPRPRGQAQAQDRRLRRARRRPALDRVLQSRRPRLRVLLAVPGPHRPARRGAGLARREERGRLGASDQHEHAVGRRSWL